MSLRKSLTRPKSLSFFKDKDDFDQSLLEGRPVKQGFLIKHKCIRGDWEKATISNNWRKRWFQLIGTNLIYFKLPSDTKPKGYFDIAGGSVEMAEERTGKKLCFAVHTKQNTTFLMIANTTDILANWLTVIKAITEPDMDPPTPRSPSLASVDKPSMLRKISSLDVLGRPKPPPISLAIKRVRFKTEIQGDPPAPRSHHVAFLVDGVRMLVFGGGNDEAVFGDVTVFNLGSASWDPYSITGEAPAPRTGHTMSVYREFVYCFGGRDMNQAFDDVFELNVDELQWDSPAVTGTPPCPRHHHAATVLKGSLYVFGGATVSDELLNDLYVLDLTTMEWTFLESDPDDPIPPHSHSYCAGYDENFVSFGGYGENGLSNMVLMYDSREQVWVTEQPKGVAPSPRKNVAGTPFKNRVMFLLGGETEEGLVNDTWALDVTGYVWMKIQMTGNPLANACGMSIVVKDQVLYICGGKEEAGYNNGVAVLKISDKGLPSINLRTTARPSFVQRMQLKHPCMQDFDVGVTLGTGSFGRVSCVRYKRSGQYYALKVLKKKEIIHLNQVDHINAEREVLSSISHPHIVNFCGSFQDSKKLYIVMEFVSGGEFFTHLRRAGRFKEDVARFYAAQILSALAYLHENNIVYRDLKPENILLDSKGHAKITDFGFAKQVEFRTWTLCGTPEYLSPEIILSKGHSKPADYWALGILCYEMLAGYPPFYDDEPLRIYQKILQGNIKWPYHFSPEAKDFISGLLVADANKRLGSNKKGADAIKEHPWFKTIDWQDISGTSLAAPIQPNVGSEGDTSNFDNYPDEQEEEWPDCTEAENAKFANFG